MMVRYTVMDVKKILDDQIKQYINDYIEQHTYIKTRNISVGLANLHFNIYKKHPNYYTVRDTFTIRVKDFLRQLCLDGVLEIYNRNGSKITYKRI